MINIDRASAISLLAEAVEERGRDYVNPVYRVDGGRITDVIDWERTDSMSLCRYVGPDGTPSCIVGTALAKAGVPLDALAKYENMAADKVVWNLMVDGILGDAGGAIRAFFDAQTVQDAGRTWGEALDAV